MRTKSLITGVGATLLATPALAHVGDHGEHGAAHFLAQHGLAAAFIALTLAAGTAAIIYVKRKG